MHKRTTAISTPGANGPAIRAARKAHGSMSICELAEITGYNKGHLSRVETGASNGSMEFVAAVAKALGINPQDITATVHRTTVTTTKVVIAA